MWSRRAGVVGAGHVGVVGIGVECLWGGGRVILGVGCWWFFGLGAFVEVVGCQFDVFVLGYGVGRIVGSVVEDDE